MPISEKLSVAQMMDQPLGCHKFVTGLKVLLVDDKPEYLEVLGNTLQVLCEHEVIKCTGARDALSKLEEKKDGFDLVLAEHAMRETDGLQLLDSIRSMEIANRLPVLLFSDNLDMDVVERAIEKGACDFLVKPISDDQLKMIWRHVFSARLRKDLHAFGDSDANQPQRSSHSGQPLSEDSARSSGMKSWPNGDNMDIESNNQKCSKGAKKPRVHWTPELQQKFKEAIDQIIKRKNPGGRLLYGESGEWQVVPKEILDKMREMGERGLTRQNVSSYLQKYRTNMKKQVEEQRNGQLAGFSSPGQYSSLPIRSHPPPTVAPYPAPTRHLPSQNLSISHRPQQLNKYFPTGQQVGPLPVGPMNQQLTSPLNHINQLNFQNLCPNNVNRSPALMNLPFGTPSVFTNQYQPLIPDPQPMDHPTFSPALDPYLFVSAPLNEDIGQQFGFDNLDDMS